MNDPVQVRVVAKTFVADEIAAFNLSPIDAAVPDFQAGARIDIQAPALLLTSALTAARSRPLVCATPSRTPSSNETTPTC